MHDAIAAVLERREGVGGASWHSLWDRLDEGALDRAEATALLAALTSRLPDQETLRALLASLRERRPMPATGTWAGTVNIVGTGGGPKTFNISTAAAFVAAAVGVRVVKTGSRAHTGKVGSIDLLDRLGIGLTTSTDHTADTLDRLGIAFAGPFVYPPALTRLARIIMPLSMRPFGGFLNALGPFLPALPVTAQLTGVSAQAQLTELRHLAASIHDRRIWLCTNDVGTDELLGFAVNTIYPNDGASEITLPPGALTPATGAIEDLRPVEDIDRVVDHFLTVVSGGGGDVATRTICLNAAALAVLSGHIPDWVRAMDAAEEAVCGGAVRALVERVRTDRPRGIFPVRTATRAATTRG